MGEVTTALSPIALITSHFSFQFMPVCKVKIRNIYAKVRVARNLDTNTLIGMDFILFLLVIDPFSFADYMVILFE